MTVEEKIGQLMQLTTVFFTEASEEETGPWKGVGIDERDLKYVGSVLGAPPAETFVRLQKKHMEEDRNRIPRLFMSDVVHGYRTIYPIPLGLGASFDPELVFECTSMAAREAAAGGIHVTFAPMVDYARDARWGRVMETFGEDPYMNSVMGATEVRAFQGDDLKSTEHIAACVKHFAAYGGVESGRDYNTVEISERLLREYYFPAYKACVDAGVAMVMPSFNSLNGVPSTCNPWLMDEVLRDEWGFDGAVISDHSAVGELKNHGVSGCDADSAELAFRCGCTIEMMSLTYYKNLKKLIEDGRIKMWELDAAVEKVLELKEALGLFDDPTRGASPEKEAEICFTSENRAIARRAAEESAVLLKNDGVLPFSEDIKKIALIGPFATTNMLKGPWSCRGKHVECVSIYEGISKLLPNAEITVAEGCSATWEDMDESGLEDAVAVARAADAVILCLGEPHEYVGEACSRVRIGLAGLQNKLATLCVEANKNTAAVLINGRPLTIGELDSVCPAILELWYAGTESGNAAAELLFGRVNPSGKISMSFPQTVGQCPIYYNHPSTGRPRESDNDGSRFTSRYIDCGNLPLYSFGHGLSYTSFEYEAMELDTHKLTKDGRLTVSVKVRNVGAVDGKEVVQLYMRDLVASTVRPVQQLIGFKKIIIPSGESRTVSFEITEPMLRFYDANCDHISEAGEFELFVGYADHKYLRDSFELI